jgi:hypothetical protein
VVVAQALRQVELLELLARPTQVVVAAVEYLQIMRVAQAAPVS